MGKKQYLTLEPIQAQRLDPHNAYLITPRGIRVSVNITLEAAAVWERYGFMVEWIAPRRESEAA